MRVLLVEDDARAAQALVRGLREHGYQVELAEDGLKGLALARTLELDGLILDVGLPGLDGFSLLSDLRGSGIQTPVLILTAKDSLEDRLRGLELGGGDYLVKPFSFTELLLRLHNLLRRGPAAPVYREAKFVHLARLCFQYTVGQTLLPTCGVKQFNQPGTTKVPSLRGSSKELLA